MQVACKHCDARYEFDAALIPAEGYEARCTSCQQVFFVSTEAAALVSVSCHACGAIYEFNPADIPAAGYDAQCTHCQSVFFVSAAPAPAPVDPAELAPPPALSPAPLSPEDLAAAPPHPAPERRAPVPPRPARSAADDLLALDGLLGEPAAAPAGASMEEDFEVLTARRRRRLVVAVAAIALLAAAAPLTYLISPSLWDATLGPLFGIKAQVNPAAVALRERAERRMLDDSEAAYAEAIDELDSALALDRLYPEALALAATARLFRGADLQERGRAIRAEAERLLTELQLLIDAEKAPADAAQSVEELRARVSALNQQSTELFQRGGDDVTKAKELLAEALKAFEDVPLVVLASGLFMAKDPDTAAKAKEHYDAALRLQGIPGELDLRSPPDAWSPFLLAEVEAESPERAAAALQAALARAPTWQRPRVELALLLERGGKLEQARALAREIAARVPAHARAQRLLERTAAAAAAASAVVPEPPPAAGKWGKAKGSRGGKAKRKRP